jgi:hypothetical protein
MGAGGADGGGGVKPLPTGPQAARGELTFKAFRAAMQVNVRVRLPGGEINTIAEVVSIQPNAGMIVVQWSGTVLPRAGLDINCQGLVAGVLYVARGHVEDITPGKNPRVKLHVEERCVAVPLRKHHRWIVQGRLEFSAPGAAPYYVQNLYHEMNVSLGGFGSVLPLDALREDLEAIEAKLDLLVDRQGKPAEDLPGVSVTVAFKVRVKRALEGTANCYAGLEFIDLPESQLNALVFWLNAHESYLREG